MHVPGWAGCCAKVAQSWTLMEVVVAGPDEADEAAARLQLGINICCCYAKRLVCLMQSFRGVTSSQGTTATNRQQQQQQQQQQQPLSPGLSFLGLTFRRGLTPDLLSFPPSCWF